MKRGLSFHLFAEYSELERIQYSMEYSHRMVWVRRALAVSRDSFSWIRWLRATSNLT